MICGDIVKNTDPSSKNFDDQFSGISERVDEKNVCQIFSAQFSYIDTLL